VIFLGAILDFLGLLADYLPEILGGALAISGLVIIGTSTYQVTQGILSSGQAIEQAISVFVELMPFIVLALMLPTILRVFSRFFNSSSKGGSS